MRRISRKPIDLLAEPSRFALACPKPRVSVTARRSPSCPPISVSTVAPFSTGIPHKAEESTGVASKVRSWLWGKDKTESEGLPERSATDQEDGDSPSHTDIRIQSLRGDGLERVGTPNYVENLGRGKPPKHQRFGGMAKPAQMTPEVKRHALLQAMKAVYPNVSQEELLRFELRDPKKKFKIAKGFQKRTGMLVPDPILNSSKRGKDMLLKLTEVRYTPKKVHEKVSDGKVLEQLPNVTFSARRLGKPYRETQIGRWKLIGEQFDEREKSPWKRKRKTDSEGEDTGAKDA